jgi:hypothetical protein
LCSTLAEGRVALVYSADFGDPDVTGNRSGVLVDAEDPLRSDDPALLYGNAVVIRSSSGEPC